MIRSGLIWIELGCWNGVVLIGIGNDKMEWNGSQRLQVEWSEDYEDRSGRKVKKLLLQVIIVIVIIFLSPGIIQNLMVLPPLLLLLFQEMKINK